MPSDKHENKIEKIRCFLEGKGWKCAKNVPINRDNGTYGLLDLCCDNQFRNEKFCFEVEHSQSQAVKNMRDLEAMGKVAKAKRMRYRKCQLGSDENWKEVCK